MDLLLLLKALILGVVEGLTEFLPVSSTGHLIIAGDLLNFNDERGKVFEIVIQLAAILAVVWEYRAKIWQVVAGLPSEPGAQKFAFNLIVAFLPSAILGLMFAGAIKIYLFNPITVAAAFIIGGLLILWAERREHQVRVFSVDEMTWQDALKVGFAQALAMIPGTSRSGATIIGGLFVGLERRTAAEFSFFLAIPTLFAATFYDVYKHHEALSFDDIGVFAVGSIASFVSAFFCVRWLLRYISHHDFTPFAWYRIAFGVVVLVTAYTGVVDWSAGS
ncbi:MAG: undecaprenyl-diphosphatase [Gammaproteobacteria bacterium RIFOXYA12_FULL_61_12]|nr:MAG: undecaprenyl-diphosphatase [Gammaproteobacteria bacterium RIFOXYD12_FULL_61_37]OGT90027.1 MAG: undecaprenyl-diphosphatase [Gammaproteobacteria bacterium RIFOXYA12_FULL_61_12]